MPRSLRDSPLGIRPSEQVKLLLTRLYQTIPLPCAIDDVYFGCLPAWIKDWHEGKIFNGGMLNMYREHNLVKTMFATWESASARGNPLGGFSTLNFNIPDSDQVFWIKVPAMLPTPRNSIDTPFMLPPDHPNVVEIRQWVNRAYDLSEMLDPLCRVMERFDILANSPARVEAAWPELLHYVKLPTGYTPLPQVERNSIRKELHVHVEKHLRDQLMEQLAACVLLNEKFTLNAWILYHHQL